MNKNTYLKYHRDSDYQENEGLFKNIFAKRVGIVKKYITTPGRVLDIGASTGTMLDIFKETGWQTFGVEPSASAKYAVKKGHKITNDFFENAEFPREYFDLVIMNHTLEHVKDAAVVLNKIFKILKKNGIVLIDVPNAGGLGSRLMGPRWPYRLPLEHTYQFTKASLSKLIKDAGFKIVNFQSRSGLFEYASPFRELWRSLINFKKRFFVDLLLFPYSLLSTSFNMGDSMSIVAKKV